MGKIPRGTLQATDIKDFAILRSHKCEYDGYYSLKTQKLDYRSTKDHPYNGYRIRKDSATTAKTNSWSCHLNFHECGKNPH